MLTDDGLHLYSVSSLRSKYVEFVPWGDDSFIGKVSGLIVKKCGKKPVVILNDMVEQHYRKEKLPKTSVMDKGAIIKRRLSVAFPNYPIRSALKIKSEDKAAGVSNYLFAAIPQSDAYKKMVEAVRLSGASIVGLYLLPIEGATMVRTLAQKQSKKYKTRSQWTIFVGQHHGGGLRQIVTKGGDLALTRMTPVVDTDVESEVWVKEVASELQSTMSYLARFGYKQEDGLDIFVVANENAQELLEKSIDISSNLYCLNASEVGSLIGSSIGKQDDLRYADPLYASWVGKQRKFVLPMHSQSLSDIEKPRKIANLAMLILGSITLYLSYDSFSFWNKYALAYDNLNVLRQENSSLKQEYKTMLSEKSVEGYDYLLVNNVTEIYDDLILKKTDPLVIVRALGESLGPNLTVDKIEIESVLPAVVDFSESDNYEYGESVAPKPEMLVMATVTISFAKRVDTEVAVNKVTELVKDISLKLPKFNVSVEKQVGGVSYSETFAEEIGGSQADQSLNKTAIISIKQRPAIKTEEEL